MKSGETYSLAGEMRNLKQVVDVAESWELGMRRAKRLPCPGTVAMSRSHTVDSSILVDTSGARIVKRSTASSGLCRLGVEATSRIRIQQKGTTPECHRIKRKLSGDGDEASLAMRCQRDQ